MGRCCKCGKETPHVYAYYSGNSLNAKRPKTYTNVEERAGFLCTRCAIGYDVLNLALGSTACVVSAINAGTVVGTVIIGITAAAWFAVFVHALVVMRRDKALPFYIYKSRAEKRLVKRIRKQYPDKTYFTSSKYHKLTGGIIP